MRISVDLKDSFDYCFENFVENFLVGEGIEQRINNLRNAFARLLEHLVGNGTIDAETFSEILESRAIDFVHDVKIHGTHLIKGCRLVLVVDSDPRIYRGHYIRTKHKLWYVCSAERATYAKTMNLIIREIANA